MSLLVKDQESLSLLRSDPPRLVRMLRVGWPLVVSLAVLWGTGVASATEPAKRANAAKAVTQKEPAKDAGMAKSSVSSAVQSQPAKIPEQQAGTCGGDAQPGAAAKEATGAKWVCTEPNLTLQPLWRGQEIECAWMIRNEGTGSLEINAKGG